MSRTGPGPELGAFAAIYERLARREPLTHQDRRKLESLLKQLLAGDDVRRKFYEPVEGRPRNDELAAFIAAAVELQRQPGLKLKAVVGAVAADWGIPGRRPDAFVARQHRFAGKFAREWIARSTREGVAAVVEWHREKYLNSR